MRGNQSKFQRRVRGGIKIEKLSSGKCCGTRFMGVMATSDGACGCTYPHYTHSVRERRETQKLLQNSNGKIRRIDMNRQIQNFIINSIIESSKGEEKFIPDKI